VAASAKSYPKDRVYLTRICLQYLLVFNYLFDWNMPSSHHFRTSSTFLTAEYVFNTCFDTSCCNFNFWTLSSFRTEYTFTMLIYFSNVLLDRNMPLRYIDTSWYNYYHFWTLAIFDQHMPLRYVLIQVARLLFFLFGTFSIFWP
jgi:hypothetical protein